MTNKTNNIEIKRDGLMLVLSSPSGAGKTTISREILNRDSNIEMSVSATTRKMRPGEKDGEDYYFLNQDKFSEMVKNQEFLEHAEVFGNNYGTPKKAVSDKLSQGKDILFDIDWQGTKILQDKCGADVVSIFILPPSIEELEIRLRKRAQDDEEVIRARMAKAKGEIEKWNIYDYVLVNEDIEASVNKVLHILNSERQKRFRQTGLQGFVDKLLG